ncbi:MAG: S-methyl-5-thioribose-1-phosphate isomerase [Candidatus Bathyarchaeia archaeon]
MELRKVVTVFLEYNGLILILKRSGRVGTFKGKWAGVSGYIEGNEDPSSRALIEIQEEVGLNAREVHLAVKGKLLLVPDKEKNVLWVVYPYLFKADKPSITVNWENEEYRWIKPEEIDLYETVPMLRQALMRVKFDARLPPSPDVARKLWEIASDRKRGARQLAVEAAQTLRLAADACELGAPEECLRRLEETAERLRNLKPSMCSIANIIDLLCSRILRLKATSLASLKISVAREVEEAVKGLELSSKKAVREACRNIGDGYTVLTHSNSSMVIETFKQVASEGRRMRVVVSESRPLCEGREVAAELSTVGVPVTLITDAAVGHFITEADMVLVGADSVLADGSLVNKVGTYLIALAAKDKGIPFYAVCEFSKFDVRNYLGEEPILEERDPSDVLDSFPPSMTVRNLYFDITPPSLISGIITEDGVVEPASVPRYMEKLLQRHLLEP